jgi:release factor glutamine methyltransferase
LTTLGNAWRLVRDEFRAAGIDTPELDAQCLARIAFGCDVLRLAADENQPAGDDGLARLQDLAARRLTGEPVARILGHKEFYGLDFNLNTATLVPRPETELLVDLAMQVLQDREGPQFVDLGTGTGCVAISILRNEPRAAGIATDLSQEALTAARGNAAAIGVADRLQLREGNWYGALLDGELFDLIVSNPPYVESEIIEELMPDVRDFDPALALDGGPDGLHAYRAIAKGAARWLKPGGTLMVEIGSEQGLEVGALFAALGLTQVEIKKDLAGLDRVVIGHHVLL